MRALTRWMARVIPDSANRSLWWLVTLTLGALALPGPFWGALITIQVTGKSYWPEALLGLVANAAGMLVSVGVLALLLRRRPADTAGVARDIGYVLVVSVIGAAVRLLMVWLLQIGPQPMGRWAIITQLSVVIPLIGANTVAIIYAAQRQREITAGYRETAAARAALAREEEDVRGRIFDELHGTLQSVLVDARRQLVTLARQPQPVDRDALLGLEQRLGELYATDVASLAGSLYPVGLEVGLGAGLRQLTARFADTTRVQLEIDPVTQAFDDPVLGGLSREVRFAAYRVVEECVVNAMRHGATDTIDVELRSYLQGERPMLTILARNRCTHDAQVTPGHGLTRMRQRVEGFGGRLDVSVDQDSFVVAAELPVQRD